MGELISATEAADYMKVSRATIHNFVKRGLLPVKAKLGKQEQIFLDRSDVVAFAEQYTKNGKAA